MLPPFSLIIPAFNEERRLGETLPLALAYLREQSPGSELLLVDDGSTDRTAAVARAAFGAAGPVEARVLESGRNFGKGHAVRCGLLAAAHPIALFSDADLSTPITEAPKLLEPILRDELDVAFGSRALDRTLIGDRQPWRREQGGRVFNLLVRLATGLPFWDTQCGFKAFRLANSRPLLEAAQIDRFAFDVELLYLARRAGLRLGEIAVRWDHREGSKVHFLHDSRRMLHEIFLLRQHARRGLRHGGADAGCAVSEARRTRF